MTSIPNVTAGGATIPAIGYGTWPLKGEECSRAVATAIETGYRHIDTAAMYDNEASVGEGLRAGGVARDKLWVTTKVWWENIGDGAMQRSAEASLKRLGVDQVDLFLIHWPNPAIPVKESIKALNDVKRSGMARNIGVSNFTTALLDEAVSRSDEPIVTNQCEYHPHLDQSKVLEACRKHGVAFVSYCPLGRGAVGGVLSEPAVQEMAERYERTPAQVILRWHLQQPNVIAVPKSGNPKRIVENFNVTGFELSDADMKTLSGLAKPDGRVVNLAFAPKWD